MNVNKLFSTTRQNPILKKCWNPYWSLITQKYSPLQLRSDGITRLGLFYVTPSCKHNLECHIVSPGR